MNRHGVPDPRQHASSASGPDGHFPGKPPLSSSGPNFDGRRILQRHELIASGMSGRAITEAVRTRSLLRVRRDHYALPDTDVHTLEAVRVGGRLACVSAAVELGIFAFDATFTHLHVARRASRLRSPQFRRVGLSEMPRNGVELHWWPLIEPVDGSEYCVGARDALAQLIRCQPRNFAVAALDTALHEGAIRHDDLPDIFQQVPDKYQDLRALIDARADAGQESVLRRLVRDAGLRCQIQVAIDGVGRVDMVVEDCVVVEADSRSHHKEWAQHVRDRTRDRLLAERGYPSLRVLYQDIFFDPAGVVRAIEELVRICRNGSLRS
jgi:very-short-patch-repair endonuclease